VSATYTVVYGFGGFRSPLPGSTLTKSAGTIHARFRLTDASGTPIAARTAAALAAAHKIRMTLAGPGIRPVTAACQWDTAARTFGCAIKIPSGAKTGNSQRYTITAAENLSTGYVRAPAVGRAVNPESIHFR